MCIEDVYRRDTGLIFFKKGRIYATCLGQIIEGESGNDIRYPDHKDIIENCFIKMPYTNVYIRGNNDYPYKVICMLTQRGGINVSEGRLGENPEYIYYINPIDNHICRAKWDKELEQKLEGFEELFLTTENEYVDISEKEVKA